MTEQKLADAETITAMKTIAKGLSALFQVGANPEVINELLGGVTLDQAAEVADQYNANIQFAQSLTENQEKLKEAQATFDARQVAQDEELEALNARKLELDTLESSLNDLGTKLVDDRKQLEGDQYECSQERKALADKTKRTDELNADLSNKSKELDDTIQLYKDKLEKLSSV